MQIFHDWITKKYPLEIGFFSSTRHRTCVDEWRPFAYEAGVVGAILYGRHRLVCKDRRYATAIKSREPRNFPLYKLHLPLKFGKIREREFIIGGAYVLL